LGPNKAYTSIYGYFVNTSYQLKAYLLETIEFPRVSHRYSFNIAVELQQVIDNWKLPENKSAVTTDNGSNIVAGFDLTGWLSMPCFSHTLQLVVEVVLKLSEVLQALAGCKI